MERQPHRSNVSLGKSANNEAGPDCEMELSTKSLRGLSPVRTVMEILKSKRR